MGDRSNDRSAGARTQVEDGGRVVAQQLGVALRCRAGAGTEAAGGRPAAVLSGGDRPNLLGAPRRLMMATGETGFDDASFDLIAVCSTTR